MNLNGNISNILGIFLVRGTQNLFLGVFSGEKSLQIFIKTAYLVSTRYEL